MSTGTLIPGPRVGIGWRQPHYRELLERRPAIDFLEVHAENFFADGGPALQVLEAGRASWPVSLHGVGLALGSAAGLDGGHLERLARLVERIEPVHVSDHACFGRGVLPGGRPVHANDLLPVAFTRASLAMMAGNVERVQARLKRTILVENLSAVAGWADADMDEAAFLDALAARTGCSLLLDVNNLVVNARNAGAADPVATACAFVDRLRPGSVGELHVAGHAEVGDLVIDDHGSRVSDGVWAVAAHALARLGPVPVLVEWDTDLPPLDVLLGEAATARALARAA